MTQDLRDYARVVLSGEPTRSLPLRVLRERLRQAAGERLPGTQQLEQVLAADPSFRLLTPPSLIQGSAAGYSPEVLAAGFPAPEPRVLLAEAGPDAADPPGLFGDTRDSLLALLARAGMHADVAEAIAALEEIGATVRDPAAVTSGEI